MPSWIRNVANKANVKSALGNILAYFVSLTNYKTK